MRDKQAKLVLIFNSSLSHLHSKLLRVSCLLKKADFLYKFTTVLYKIIELRKDFYYHLLMIT